MGLKGIRRARKPVLRVVPWFSMNELVTVYQLLYSQNIGQQKIGLDRMISWKARCSNLPVGMECTLGIAQVLFEDPEHVNQMSVSITRDQQLRLIYSSAVMRFLNLMLEFNKHGDLVGTMFNKAAKLNIPEWIVNLRHDAAHSVALPDLSLLRTAAVFIFKWLDEHYWISEIHTVSDWKVTEAEVLKLSSKERELQDIMETWEALSLYSLAGFHQLRLIPDNELMGRITSIHQMLSDNDGGEPGVQLEINQPLVSTALKLVLRRIGRFFKKSSLGKATYLANILVDGDFFLPSPSLMKILYPDGYDSQSVSYQLPQALSNSCEDLVFSLWNLGAIPDLVSKLISVSCDVNESDLRRNMAALWVQKILLSCLKAREARKVFSAVEDNPDHELLVSHYEDLHPNSTKRSITLSLAFSAVDNQRPDLKEGYTWNTLTHIPLSLTSLNLVKQCFLQPSKYISIFLPSLMEFTSPPIPLISRTLLLKLLEDFNSDELGLEERSESQTFSLEDLPSESSPGVEKNSTHDQVECTEQEEKSHWTLSQDHLEWRKCPLGVLPWQREQDHLDQEECDGKQQQRTWPKLLMGVGWTNIASENSDPMSHFKETPALKRVKDGRVKKHSKQTPVKIFTPTKVLKSGKFSPSPQQKAIEVLKSL